MRSSRSVLATLALTSVSGLAAQPTTVAKAAQNSAMHLEFWTDRIGNYIDTHGSAILCALIVIVIGFVVSKRVVRLVQRWLETKPIEPPLRSLLCRIAHLIMLALFLMVALQTAGIAITPLLTGLGVAGVGVSLASQGVLSNVVAGLVIIFSKPFRVGEYVEVIGVEGKVEAVELMSTTLSHPDHSMIHIPNRKLVGEVIHNFGAIRQLDLVASVAYATHIPDALAAINEVLKDNSRVMKEHTPLVAITEFADSSINIAVKPWVKVNDYVAAKGEIYQAILDKFHDHQIQVPFPQREIRILNEIANVLPSPVQSRGI